LQREEDPGYLRGTGSSAHRRIEVIGRVLQETESQEYDSNEESVMREEGQGYGIERWNAGNRENETA